MMRRIGAAEGSKSKKEIVTNGKRKILKNKAAS
jgi:hypothetical protein